MNKSLKVLLILLLIIPVFISAKTYKDGLKAASLLLDKNYKTYTDYLLYGKQPYVYKNGKNIKDDNFDSGGFLNIEEYIISLPNNGKTSYLSIGDEFFVSEPGYVIAGASSSENYNNKNVLGLKRISNDDAYVRVTEFVMPQTKVVGIGTADNPWIFATNFKLQLEYKKGRIASLEVNDVKKTNFESNCYKEDCYLDLGTFRSGCTTPGCVAKIKIKENGSYKYAYNTCGGRVEGDYLVIDNIVTDLKCKLLFGNGTYKVTIGDDPTGKDKKTDPKLVYLKYGENYYEEQNSMNPIFKLRTLPDPITGYQFDGYYYNDIKIIDKTGNFINKTSIAEDTVLKHTKNPIPYNITYNLGDGTNNANNKTVYTIETPTFSLGDPIPPSGKTFSGWTGSNIVIKTKSVSIPQGSTGNREFTANYCNNCPSVSNGNCSLNSNTCEQTITCNTGYRLNGTKCDPDKYTITFNANGGTPATQTRTVTVGNSYGTFPSVSRRDYSFDGWFTAARGGTQVSSSSKPTRNTTLYAHWTAYTCRATSCPERDCSPDFCYNTYKSTVNSKYDWTSYVDEYGTCFCCPH